MYVCMSYVIPVQLEEFGLMIPVIFKVLLQTRADLKCLFLLKGQPGDPGIKGVKGSDGTRGFPVGSSTLADCKLLKVSEFKR